VLECGRPDGPIREIRQCDDSEGDWGRCQGSNSDLQATRRQVSYLGEDVRGGARRFIRGGRTESVYVRRVAQHWVRRIRTLEEQLAGKTDREGEDSKTIVSVRPCLV